MERNVLSPSVSINSDNASQDRSQGQTTTPNSNGSINGSNILLANGLHALSCVTCAKRKVKCDRLEPTCTNCSKHGISCEYREAAPKGRKRKPPDEAAAELRARVKRYEAVMRDNGIDVQSVRSLPGQRSATMTSESSYLKRQASDHSTGSPNNTPNPTSHDFPGRLVVHRGKTRYVEGNIWTKMGEEEKEAMLQELSDEDLDEGEEDDSPQFSLDDHEGADLVLGMSPKHVSLHDLYPPVMYFPKIWLAFHRNVHPVTMCCHAPTVRETLFKALESPESVPKDVEALLFSIVAMAYTSMPEDECLRIFAEEKQQLRAKALYGARHALSNAKFLLSSSFLVLQALYYYILAVRSTMDPRAAYNLTGILLRNGQRLGLHKNDQTAGLKPFEIEMRRRMWFQIVMLDIMAAQVAGAASSLSNLLEPLTNPLNVNDCDLYPDMKELPQEVEGATEMIFCCLRLRMFGWFVKLHAERQRDMTGGVQGVWPPNMASGIWPADMANDHERKEKLIDGIEQQVELELLRYCDPLDPVHYLTTFVARLVINKMKFAALHPRHLGEKDTPTSKTQSDQLFRLALRVLQYDNTAHGEKMMQRFLWHSHAHFQWSCLVHVLEELKERTMGDEAEHAWEQVNMIYHYRPEITAGRKIKLPLYAAVHKMVLEAWRRRERDCLAAGEMIETPECILVLRDRANSMLPVKRDSTGNTPNQMSIETAMNQQNFNPSSNWSTSFQFGDMAASPMQTIGTGFNQYEYNVELPLTNNAGPVDWSVFDNMMNDNTNMPGFGGYFDDQLQASRWQMGAQSF